jgi:acetylornithine aminotransferase
LTEALGALDEVVSVRGRGLLLAAELGPDADAKAIVAAALDEGLVANAITPTAVRFAPSLLVTDDEIDRGVEIFAKVVGS